MSKDIDPKDQRDLSATVRSMRPFVPARDIVVSEKFYADLGFTVTALGGKLFDIRLGNQAFLLQNYYVEEWASNFMMHLMVDNLERWWNHISGLDLVARYGVSAPRPPQRESWGLDVAYVVDPSGVLWHITQEPSAN